MPPENIHAEKKVGNTMNKFTKQKKVYRKIEETNKEKVGV